MDERILHIVFDKSEADIICWMRSLPPGSVNSTVNKILSAENKGKLANIPYKFSFASDVEKNKLQIRHPNQSGPEPRSENSERKN